MKQIKATWAGVLLAVSVAVFAGSCSDDGTVNPGFLAYASNLATFRSRILDIDAAAMGTVEISDEVAAVLLSGYAGDLNDMGASASSKGSFMVTADGWEFGVAMLDIQYGIDDTWGIMGLGFRTTDDVTEVLYFMTDAVHGGELFTYFFHLQNMTAANIGDVMSEGNGIFDSQNAGTQVFTRNDCDGVMPGGVSAAGPATRYIGHWTMPLEFNLDLGFSLGDATGDFDYPGVGAFTDSVIFPGYYDVEDCYHPH